MFIRENRNRSGSVSIQIVSKQNGKYKVVKTVGCATMCPQIEALKIQAKMELEELCFGKNPLFLSEQDELVERTMQSLSNSGIRTVGPELVFGRIYDFIGFGAIDEELFCLFVGYDFCFNSITYFIIFSNRRIFLFETTHPFIHFFFPFSAPFL